MKKTKLMIGLTELLAVSSVALALETRTIEAHTRTIKITVDKNGFSPSSTDVETGHKVNLVFNRIDKAGCGSTVSIPKLNVRKALPVGKDVIVSFTPTQTGQITFSCGTGKHKGSLIVSEG